MFCYDYPRPAVTVDIVVCTSEFPDVLLIQREHAQFEGCWVLPGGFIKMEMDEIIRKALSKLK